MSGICISCFVVSKMFRMLPQCGIVMEVHVVKVDKNMAVSRVSRSRKLQACPRKLQSCPRKLQACPRTSCLRAQAWSLRGLNLRAANLRKAWKNRFKSGHHVCALSAGWSLRKDWSLRMPAINALYLLICFTFLLLFCHKYISVSIL